MKILTTLAAVLIALSVGTACAQDQRHQESPIQLAMNSGEPHHDASEQGGTQASHGELYEVHQTAFTVAGVIFLVIALGLSVFVCMVTPKVGWDYFVVIPTAIVLAGGIAIMMVVGASLFQVESLWKLFALEFYVMITGFIAMIFLRTKVLEWYTNSEWYVSGNNAVAVLKNQISHRYGVEAFAMVWALLLGWCGGFLLGIYQLKKADA